MTSSPQTETAAPPKHGFLRRHWLKLAASAFITYFIITTVRHAGLGFVPNGSDLARVRWWTVPLYVATLAVMFYFRSVRWRFLLRNIAEVPKKRLLAVSCIGFAAILALPLRLGEVVRPYMIREKGKVSFTAATSTVLGERVIDGLYLSIVLAVALILVPVTQPLDARVGNLAITVGEVRMYGFGMLGLFTVAFSVIAVFYFARGFAHKATIAIVGRVSMKLAEKLAGTFEKFAHGLGFLGRGKDAAGFLVETTLYWGANAFGMWLLAWGCGVVHPDGTSISFGEVCAIMGMLGATILIPGPPGMVGVFQAGMYAGMAMYFTREMYNGPGEAYVFLLFVIQVAWTLLIAAYFLATDRKNRRALEGADEPVVTEAEAT